MNEEGSMRVFLTNKQWYFVVAFITLFLLGLSNVYWTVFAKENENTVQVLNYQKQAKTWLAKTELPNFINEIPKATVKEEPKIDYSKVKVPVVKKAPKNDKEDPQNKRDPSKGNSQTTTVKEALAKYETAGTSLGIDISKWNGKVDFKKIKESGIDFVIIRAGYRGTESGTMFEDPLFETNMKGAIAAGLKVGVYFFSVAITKEEALEEAAWVTSKIAKYPITYPVVFDFETFGDRAANLTNTERTDNALAFLSYVKAKGYQGMMYSSKNAYLNRFETSRFAGYKIWLAHYTTKTDYKGKYHMWQYTSEGKVPGVNGKVDMNVAYFKYTLEESAKKPEPEESEEEKFLKTISLTTDEKDKITINEVILRSSPSTKYPNTITKISAQTTVKQLGITNNDWIKVSYNNQTGYVPKEALNDIQTEPKEETP